MPHANMPRLNAASAIGACETHRPNFLVGANRRGLGQRHNSSGSPLPQARPQEPGTVPEGSFSMCAAISPGRVNQI